MAEIISNTLYATTPGTSLHLEVDALRIYHPDTGARRLPLIRVDHIVAFAGVTVTDELLHRCATDQRSVTWLTGSGRFRARIIGPQGGNPLLRIAQHDALRNHPQRLSIASRLVAGKLQNTRQLLLKAAADAEVTRKAPLRDTAAHLEGALTSVAAATDLNILLGFEGQAARRYVGMWRHLLTSHSQIPAPGLRTSRPPTDPVNAALSFGYGMLRVAVHGALEQVGLDPYIGFMHGIRPGKPALALDMMEEFRQLLVDRMVFTALNRQQLKPGDFRQHPGGAHEFTDDGRRSFLALWSQARSREWPHPGLQRPVTAAVLPLIQARLMARYLRGDLPQYQAWIPA